MPDVLIELGPVAVITINRPERRNALTVDAAREVAEACESASPASRAIVLTGAGSAFCAGGDFTELTRIAGSQISDAADSLYTGYQRMIRAVREVPVPVIAAVNGHAMGAGFDLALACDLRIVSSAAQLGQVWVRLGLIPGTGGAFWTSMLAGWGRATEMLLTGEPVDAQTALSWGLVNEVVSPDQVVPRAKEIARLIAANPPGAVAANKRAINEAMRSAYESALEHARKVQSELFLGEEFRAALEYRGREGRRSGS